MREKDELVRKTCEEMKFFKLELANREENFNKNFASGAPHPQRPRPRTRSAKWALRPAKLTCGL